MKDTKINDQGKHKKLTSSLSIIINRIDIRRLEMNKI